MRAGYRLPASFARSRSVVDRIEKFLARLNAKERERVLATLLQLQERNFADLDVKKRRGKSGAFRVRVGSIRIIFQMESKVLRVISIDRRNEGTYK